MMPHIEKEVALGERHHMKREKTRMEERICHAPLLKIQENGVATRVGDVYTREKKPHVYTLRLK